MYQETQDPFYKQHADRLWNERCDPDRNEWWQIDHGTRMAVQYSAINPQCAKAWEQIANDNKTRLCHVDSYAGLYRLTGDAKWARRAADRVDAVIKDLRADRAQAKSPIMKALPEATQHVLANVRELCYAGEAVLLGRTLPPEAPAPAPAQKP
jgi:hypothetical protein